MADTFVLLGSATVASPTTTVNILDLPITYTDFAVLVSARQTTVAQTDSLNIQTQNNGGGFNATTQVTAIATDGSTSSGNVFANNGYTPAASATSGIFGSGWMYISGVQNGLFNSTVISRLCAITQNATGTEFISIKSSLYATSVKGIRFQCTNGFSTGSTFYIYGILAA